MVGFPPLVDLTRNDDPAVNKVTSLLSVIIKGSFMLAYFLHDCSMCVCVCVHVLICIEEGFRNIRIYIEFGIVCVITCSVLRATKFRLREINFSQD